MFNRSEYGLHHPGNIIPCCKSCKKRGRHLDKTYFNWEEHLKDVCSKRNENEHFSGRFKKIENNFSKYNYPALTDEEQHAIRVIANSLYENIKTESEKSLALYKELDKAFVGKAI